LFVYWTATVLHQWHRQKIRPTYQAYLERFYKHWAMSWGWPRYDFSVAHYKTLHGRVFKRPFSIRDKTLLRSASDPIPWPDKPNYGIINKTANAVSKYRDQYMVSQIYSWFKKGKQRIFVIYGSSHAVHQEPALRAMFKHFASPRYSGA
jgi:hypothetical protein